MSYPRKISRPSTRRLRVFTFDPSIQQSLETEVLNSVVVEVPWEDHPFEKDKDGPAPGPIGEYLEVIDYDPDSRCFYEPVDLNNPYLIAQDGLTPSDGDPQFHQQMVYAVSMKTIKNFERALGRPIFWSPRYYTTVKKDESDFVKRLRLYPHAMRAKNAYYSPDRKAILFGYFNAVQCGASGDHLPGGIVFTCLSHDIIVHELSHALLDGMHRRYIEPSNYDTLALHEAFADIVALFQHFSFPEAVKHQISKTRGNLATANYLAILAIEFGKATGKSGALRSAIGKPANPLDLEKAFECHERGAILVAAIFDAFLAIYRSRTLDLIRIATGGSGILRGGALHPDLINRLASEASKSADHILTICIRALDYLPPVDVNFGDYLRALITADYDMVPDDPHNYRVAFIESFRRHGIFPHDVRSMSENSLLWQDPLFEIGALPFCKDLEEDVKKWGASHSREELYSQMKKTMGKIHEIVKNSKHFEQIDFTGLDIKNKTFEVHSIRPIRRVGPGGHLLMDLLVEITQWRPGFKTEGLQPLNATKQNSDFKFRGGCTLIIDIETFKVRYCISKNIKDENRYRQQQMYHFNSPESQSLWATYFDDPIRRSKINPFARMHEFTKEMEVNK